MVGTLQPLSDKFQIVGPDGLPTLYFIKWAQQRQIDIGEAITEEDAQQLIDDFAAARQIIAGRALDGGGFLSSDVTIDHAESLVIPGTYGDATHVPQFVVDQEGHVQGVVLVPISGVTVSWGDILGTLSDQIDLQTALDGKANLAGGAAFTSDITVPDEAYGVGWNGSLEVPTKNALYDKIETISGGSAVLPVVDGSIPPVFLQNPDGSLIYAPI